MTDTALVEQRQQQPRQQHPLVALRERLEARKAELRAALADINPDQFIRALITSATINPEIQACTWQSLWVACMQACRDGLLPDGVEGAIVPYKSKAAWIPMYQGMLRRARRSGQLKWITANVVREGEEFSHYVDEQGEHFKHVPGDDFDAPILRVYAAATTLDGGVFINRMGIAEANKIKAMSRASRDDAPWKLWPEEMYKKTALRRLSKTLPSGRDIILPSERDASGPDQIEDEAQQPPAQIAPRQPGAAAALDQFSGASPEEATGAAAQGAGGLSAAADDASHGPAPAPDPAADEKHQAEIAAYRLGQQAKSSGHQRKALPGELRDKARNREAICWMAGFDGEAMPTFDQDGKELVP